MFLRDKKHAGKAGGNDSRMNPSNSPIILAGLKPD
jgi:hypothetical protein